MGLRDEVPDSVYSSLFLGFQLRQKLVARGLGMGDFLGTVPIGNAIDREVMMQVPGSAIRIFAATPSSTRSKPKRRCSLPTRSRFF